MKLLCISLACFMFLHTTAGQCNCPPSSYSGTSGKITTPNYPNNYCNNAQCTYQITVPANMMIKITLNNFNLQNPGDVMMFYDGAAMTSLMLKSLTGLYGSAYSGAPIYSGGNMMTIVFKSDASNPAQGASLTYQAVSNICGKTSLGESQSSFYSPNWEIQGNYPNNVNCAWTIQVNQGHAVQLNFLPNHNTEQGVDLVNIYNAPNTLIPIATFSGSVNWAATVSATNYLRVSFQSNGQNVYAGFHAAYRIVPQGLNCSCGQSNYQITNPNGMMTLSSPNYPTSNYCGNHNCIWTLTVPILFNVKLGIIRKLRQVLKHHLSRFSSKNEANFDYVIIFNGGSTKSPILEKCTATYCATVISKGNSMTVMFVSDYAGERSGFQANWQAVIA